MAKETVQTELLLEVLQAVGLFALREEEKRFERGQLIGRDDNGLFSRLAGNALDVTEVTKLNNGISVTKGRCMKLPGKQKDGVWWAPLLWITPKDADESDCDHLLQLVIAGTERLFGFRWEPPEGGGAGVHDYWHAQPIVSVRTIHNTEIPIGIPLGATCTHAPAFPLHVADRLSLLDALFVSLYGPYYLDEYAKENAGLQKRVLSNVDRSWAAVVAPKASPRATTKRK